MRQNLPSSIYRLCRLPHPRLQPIIRHGVRFIVTSPPHRLAQVRSDCDELPELWFSSTPPYKCTGSEQAAKNEAKANERTLKLGKSKSLICPTCLETADITQHFQLSAFSSHAYPLSSPHPSRKKYSHRKSSSTYSPPPTHISLPSPAALPTMQHYGLHPLLGVASLLSETLNSSSPPSEW